MRLTCVYRLVLCWPFARDKRPLEEESTQFTRRMKKKSNTQAGFGRFGAPETGAAAPGAATAVTVGVAAVGMPKVRLASAGIPVAGAVCWVTDAGADDAGLLKD